MSDPIEPIPDFLGLRRSPDGPTDRNRGARERLVAAGGWLLLERGRENLDELLSVQRVVRRAEASRQSWHNHFNGPDYLDALIEWCADLDAMRIAMEFFEAATGYFAGLDDPRMPLSQVVGLCAGVFEASRTDPTNRLLLILSSMAPDDPVVSSLLNERYHQRCVGAAPGFRRIFESAGYAPLLPHDFQSIAETIAALGDGFLVRSLLDPDGPWAERFASAITGFLNGALALAGPDGAPVAATEQIFPIAESTEVRVLAPPADLALASVGPALRSHRTAVISLAQIASAIGCPPSVLEGRYGSADAMVSGAWRRFVIDDVELAAHAPLAPSPLVRHLVATFADRCLAQWWLTAAAARARLERLSRVAEDPSASPIVAILLPVLVDARAATLEGQRGGPSSKMSDADLARLANRLEQSVIAEVLAGPELPAADRPARCEQIAVDVWDDLVVGIKPRR